MAAGGSGPAPPGEGPIRYGWKEIADHFGVTVRTVQLWEAEKGLPVRRLPGERGRAYAAEAELRAWRETGAGTGAAGAVPANGSGGRTRRLAGGLVLLGLAVLGGWLGWRSLRFRQPLAARVEGGVLVALDQALDTLWRTAVGAEAVAGIPHAGQSSGVQVLDLDGDGRNEVLFLKRHGGTNPPSGELLCFSVRGSPL